MKIANRVALVGMLAAVNVASRVLLQFLPNIKPTTALIILATVAFGLRFGLALSTTTVLLSGVLLGFGSFLPFQLLAWSLIAALTWLMDRLLPGGKVIAFTLWAFLCGYLYGLFVSLDKLFLAPSIFLAYYLNGLGFDTLHAVGNAIFFPLCYGALLPVFRRYAAGGRFSQKQMQTE